VRAGGSYDGAVGRISKMTSDRGYLSGYLKGDRQNLERWIRFQFGKKLIGGASYSNFKIEGRANLPLATDQAISFILLLHSHVLSDILNKSPNVKS